MKWIKKVATTPIDAVAKVIDTLQTQTNERLNAPSIRAVRDGLADKWQDIYPIGSIYMSVNDTNPSLVFGGTWQQIKDRFLLASGDTYDNGQTGGSATHVPTGSVNGHVLDYNEVPDLHGHYITYSKKSDYKILRKTDGRIDGALILTDYEAPEDGIRPIEYTGNRNDIWEGTGPAGLETADAHSHTFTGSSGNYMPPYLAVNVWVRTA